MIYLHGDFEIIYICNILNNTSITLKKYSEVYNFTVEQLYGKCTTMSRYTTNMLNDACIYAHCMTL